MKRFLIEFDNGKYKWKAWYTFKNHRDMFDVLVLLPKKKIIKVENVK